MQGAKLESCREMVQQIQGLAAGKSLEVLEYGSKLCG